MTLIIYYYSQIVKHVFSHEKALRSQAKKMNVESLRSNQKGAGNSTAEVRIAKAAITICFLFVAGTYREKKIIIKWNRIETAEQQFFYPM